MDPHVTEKQKTASYATTKPDNDEATTRYSQDRPPEQDDQADQDGQENKSERAEKKGQE
jgi:hypothetical protein